MEDTGYIARVAFVMDRLLRKIGLSGRRIVPMLIGFGCSVPAIMATRTLSSERDHKMTILLVPFMSCTAKLPIYTLIISAFFPRKYQVLIMVGLYALGIVCGILYALLLKGTKYKGSPVPFVMELPNYRFPSATSVWQLIVEKAKGFAKKAFTIIFVASLVIWFLQTFDIRLNVAASAEESLLALLGGVVAPLFVPLGFGDWRVSTALITGFTAKESVVSTLTVLLGGDVSLLGTLFTPFTAFVFLVFTLLYTPCVAAVATVKREKGGVKAAAIYMNMDLPDGPVCKKLIEEMYVNIRDCRIPTELIPHCPKCGRELEPWVRGFTFLEGEKYREEYNKWNRFLMENKDKNILFLELGVGRMTPMFIREPFWNMTYSWPKAFYIALSTRRMLYFRKN